MIIRFVDFHSNDTKELLLERIIKAAVFWSERSKAIELLDPEKLEPVDVNNAHRIILIEKDGSEHHASSIRYLGEDGKKFALEKAEEKTRKAFSKLRKGDKEEGVFFLRMALELLGEYPYLSYKTPDGRQMTLEPSEVESISSAKYGNCGHSRLVVNLSSGDREKLHYTCILQVHD